MRQPRPNLGFTSAKPRKRETGEGAACLWKPILETSSSEHRSQVCTRPEDKLRPRPPAAVGPRSPAPGSRPPAGGDAPRARDLPHRLHSTRLTSFLRFRPVSSGGKDARKAAGARPLLLASGSMKKMYLLSSLSLPQEGKAGRRQAPRRTVSSESFFRPPAFTAHTWCTFTR